MHDPDTDSFYGVPTDENGNYSLTAPPDTNYTFFVMPPPGSGLQTYMEIGVALSADMTKSIALNPGVTVSGTVTRSDTGEPVAGVSVTLLDPDTSNTYAGPPTMGNGQYSFAVPPDTNYTFMVMPPPDSGLASQFEENVSITEDTTKDIVLSPGVTVSGTITSHTGEPVPGAQVVFMNPVTGIGYFTAPTDANGNYSILVPIGDGYIFTVRPPPDSGLQEYSETVDVTGAMTKDAMLSSA
jgi:hypothetical protein